MISSCLFTFVVSLPAVLAHQAQAAHGMLHHVKGRQSGCKGKGKGLFVALSHKIGEEFVVEAGLQVEICRQHQWFPYPEDIQAKV